MSIGKTIRVFLSDATATGVRYAELVNWTGYAIACPRSRLVELRNEPEAHKPGVYFLFEGRFPETKPMVYVGESENVFGRLTSHDREKDFWNEAVIFTSKDENLTKAHVKYLESTLMSLATRADRYQLVNANSPSVSSLPRSDQDSMREFIQNLRMVLGILGYSLLEPILNSTHGDHESISSEQDGDVEISLSNLHFKIRNLIAQGALTDQGFVVKAGSQFSKTNSESLSPRMVDLKSRLLKDSVLREEGDVLVSVEDVLISSSSYAAALVAGTARSGPQSWKTTSGSTLKQIEDEQLGS